MYYLARNTLAGGGGFPPLTPGVDFHTPPTRQKFFNAFSETRANSKRVIKKDSPTLCKMFLLPGSHVRVTVCRQSYVLIEGTI